MPELRRNPLSAFSRGVRVLRSAAFVLVFSVYLVFFMGLGQRLVIIPFCWLVPSRAARVYGPWVRLQARNTLRLLRWIAGVRVTVNGQIDAPPCIVIMNHQSLIDIPIGFSVIPGPLALIPTRRKYARGIPGVSPFLRHARLPLIGQEAADRRADVAAMLEAARRTGSGETSVLIYPEGHRTSDGMILPFMPGGLQILLSRAAQPVYCVVADGMWQIPTIYETFVRVADARISVTILGPFDPPRDSAQIPAFVEGLRARMNDALVQMRGADAA